MEHKTRTKAMSWLLTLVMLLGLLPGTALATAPNPESVPVTSVTLNKTETALTVGGTETLTATVAPNNATNQNVTWSSDNGTVATVDSGTVTAVAAGTATITATTEDGNYTATCTVTVSAAAGSISYAVAEVSKTTADSAFTNELTKTGDGTVTYESSNISVATVDATGEVTIVGGGTTTITATVTDSVNYTYATKTATYTLTVGHTVTFNANGGEGTMSAQIVPNDTATALTPNAFTRTGYTFSGWNTDADGNGTVYADKASVTLTGSLTLYLYAQWYTNPVFDNGGYPYGKNMGTSQITLVCDVTNNEQMVSWKWQRSVDKTD